MAEGFDSVKNTIMTIINGHASPVTMAIQAVQDKAKETLAKAKISAQTAIQTAPQRAKELANIAKYNVEKTAKEAELTVLDNTIHTLEDNIKSQEELLIVAKDKKRQLNKQVQKLKAKKSNNTEIPDTGDDISAMVNELSSLKKHIEELETKRKSIQEDITGIDESIKECDKRIAIMDAQINPEVAKQSAQKATEDAKTAVDKAVDAATKADAERNLEEAISMEQAITEVADEQNTAVEQIKEQQEPKMMQLRAEFQFMEMGVRVFNYLLTNMTTLNTSLNSVPSTIVTGSAVGVANPAYSILFGNPNFGVLYFILGSLKASSIRFLALAQEIEYTPTTEMSTISSIKACETALNGFLANAPAGAALNI